MPKYLVDGTMHITYRVPIFADSDIEAKKMAKSMELLLFVDPECKKTIKHEVNPTVEVIQPITKERKSE